MRSWKQALTLGVFVWLIPFVVAFLIYPLHGSNRPLFESVMAVTVTATAVVMGLRYVRGGAPPAEALALGLVWLMVCVLIDAPLMLLGGPMQMTVGEYLGDIGVTYLAIPVVTWGLGAAHRAGRDAPAEETSGSPPSE